MSISVSQVSKEYGQQKALNNISFQIKPGEIVGFLGPNGAGKSTMMKILTGYLSPSEGDVAVCNLNPQKDQKHYRNHIGYLPENNPLYLDMYVKEYLQFVSNIYKLGKEGKVRIKRIIEQTGLTPERNKKIIALSKGYRQRVGLAQALLPDPEVLILDEPTTGLDPNQIMEVRELIKTIGKEKTVMLSTHIMSEVQAICERVIIINKGQLVADEKAKDLDLLSQKNEATITVEFKERISSAIFSSVPNITKVEASNENIWLLSSKITTDLRPEIFRFAIEKKLTLLSMYKMEKTLEEVFQELTNNH